MASVFTCHHGRRNQRISRTRKKQNWCAQLANFPTRRKLIFEHPVWNKADDSEVEKNSGNIGNAERFVTIASTIKGLRFKSHVDIFARKCSKIQGMDIKKGNSFADTFLLLKLVTRNKSTRFHLRF